MALWIRSAAWVLVAFAAPGLIYSLVVLDWVGAVLNVAFLIIGVTDLLNLRLLKTEAARAWNRMIWTQLALGVLIGVSLYAAGKYLIDSPYWDIARDVLEKHYYKTRIPDYLWDDMLSHSRLTLTWGTAIGGVIIFLSQLRVCQKLRRLARDASPPPLPGNSKPEKH